MKVEMHLMQAMYKVFIQDVQYGCVKLLLNSWCACRQYAGAHGWLCSCSWSLPAWHSC